MSSIAKVLRVANVPKEYFWGRLLDFGDIKSFLPENIDHVDCTGNEIGSLRTITLGEITGYPGEVVERLEGIYGDNFFVYSVIDKSCLPFTSNTFNDKFSIQSPIYAIFIAFESQVSMLHIIKI